MRLLAAALSIVLLASPALALPGQYAPLGFGGRAAAADPDEGLEHLAAASTRAPRGSGHDRPSHRRSPRDVLSDSAGPTRQAYAWVDNK